MAKVLADWAIDLIVLDLMLPGEDGLTLCRNLRSTSTVPVIMLTAMGEETDRIIGLEMGADDYLPKPFNPRELLARIKAVLRRADAQPGRRAARPMAEGEGETVLSFAGWHFNLDSRELTSPEGVRIDSAAANTNCSPPSCRGPSACSAESSFSTGARPRFAAIRTAPSTCRSAAWRRRGRSRQPPEHQDGTGGATVHARSRTMKNGCPPASSDAPHRPAVGSRRLQRRLAFYWRTVAHVVVDVVRQGGGAHVSLAQIVDDLPVESAGPLRDIRRGPAWDHLARNGPCHRQDRDPGH
jgi:hypothetical protein